MVATFAFLPPRQPEELTRTLKWRQALFAIGLAWLLFGFFGYLKFKVAPSAPNQFIDQFLGPRATVFQTLETSADLLIYGLGAWAVFACLAPRVAILAVPWIWSLCNGRWALRFLATEEWHHVRYTVLPVAMILAAGVIGYAQLGTWLKARRGGWFLLVLVWLVAALAGGLGLRELSARMSHIPRPITHSRSRRHLVLDRPGRARGGRARGLRGDRAAFLPQAALQLCPRAEQAPRLPPARPRVPVDLPPRQGSRFPGYFSTRASMSFIREIS